MLYTLDDELEVSDEETLIVYSYWDRDEDVQKYFDSPLEIDPGTELLLGHISAATPFRYTGTVDRDGTPHFHFDTTSDFAVSEVVISPAKFMLAMGDDIWFY